MVFLSGRESVQFLWIVYVFPLEISYQEGLVGIQFTGLTPPHIYLSQARTWISNVRPSVCCDLFVFSEL